MISTSIILATVAFGLSRAAEACGAEHAACMSDEACMLTMGDKTLKPRAFLECGDVELCHDLVRCFFLYTVEEGDRYPYHCKDEFTSCADSADCLAAVVFKADRVFPRCKPTDEKCIAMAQCWGQDKAEVEVFAMGEACPYEFIYCVENTECLLKLGAVNPGELPECGDNEECKEYVECEQEHRQEEQVEYSIKYSVEVEITMSPTTAEGCKDLTKEFVSEFVSGHENDPVVQCRGGSNSTWYGYYEVTFDEKADAEEVHSDTYENSMTFMLENDLDQFESNAYASKYLAKTKITPPPTPSPTDPPTDSPTSPPTDPTHSPTPSPTANPTTQPTSPPTDPTTSPTPSPTATPTASPTLEGGDDNISIIDHFTDDVPAACKSVASDCLNDWSCMAMFDVPLDNHIFPCGDSALCVDFNHCLVMEAVDTYAMANGCPDEFKACVGDYKCYALLGAQEPGELPECGENEACATYKKCHLGHLKKYNVKYEVAHYLDFEVTKPKIAENSMAKCEEYLPELTDFIKKDVPGAKPLEVASKCISDEESEFTLTFEERGENKMEERFAFSLALDLVEDGIWAEHQFEAKNPTSYSSLVEREVSEDDDGLSGGAVAGIVIGVLLALGVIGGAIIYFK